MSLIPSTNAGAPGQPYYVANDGTVQAPIIDAVGVVNFGPDANGDCFLRSAASAPTGAMALGANSTDFNHLVLSSAPKVATFNANVVMGGGLGVAGASVFSNSIDLNNQQIQNNLRFTQAFGPVADSTNDQPLGTPQPSPMPFGSYAIVVQVTGNPQIQPSCIGYWNGTTWSAGANGAAFTFPGGNVAVAIRPAVGGASLVMSNGSGAAVSGFVYYISLGEN